MRSFLLTSQLKRLFSYLPFIGGLVVWALIGASAAQAFTVPTSFVKYASSSVLRNPGIMLVDPTTRATIYSKSPDELRAPASVLKLFSMSTVLHTYSPNAIFTTTISATSQPSTFVLIGDGDPWLTSSPYESKKYHRAFLPSLINTVLADKPKLKSINLQYFGLYSADAKILKRFFTGRVKIHLIPLQSLQQAKKTAKHQIATIKSPKLSKIVGFTLLFSDNKLADRLVKMASNKLGLLVAIRRDPVLNVMYQGLPTAGKTGTLKNRFRTDAPKAVGLIHAKTGWIDNTVSLAGYVSVGKRQYVFVVVANHIRNSENDRQAARITIDKMLGTIARKGN